MTQVKAASVVGAGGVSTTRRPPRRRLRIVPLLFVLPALLLYVAFVVVPAAQTIYLSFFSWDGISAAVPVGAANYVAVFDDPLLRSSIINALLLIIFFSALPIALGLLIVGLVGQAEIKGLTYFRAVIFLPQILPLVAVGIIWRWLYEPDGLVNQMLASAGLSSWEKAWLGDPGWALIALGVVGTWALTGLCMTLFFAGAQKIDANLYDAVAVDGGGRLRQFVSVTLPGLRGEISIAITITVIAALASFDLVYVTTNGGPSNLTVVPGLLVYRLAFDAGQIGAAAALAIVLMALVLAAVVAAGRLIVKGDE